ncbi:MAG: hypothetical protein WCO83_12225 [Alphaproteobacteria bacterium]
MEMPIYARAINCDLVHMMVRIPPRTSMSREVHYLNGKR